MSFFPADPTDGDEIGPNANGTHFKYVDADNKWIIISTVNISNVAYDEGTWDNNSDGATKNVIRDKFESIENLSFNADPADTEKAGIVIDIDTTGCNTFDLVYIDGNNSVAPADASDDTKMPAIGIVIAAGKVLTHGVVKDDDLIVCTTGGAVVYASTTLRKVTETAPTGVGNMIQVVGICTGDHTLYVNVSLDMVKFKA